MKLSPRINEGVGNAGRRCTRSRAWCVVNTRVSHHESTGNNPAFPHAMVLTVSFVLPGDRAVPFVNGTVRVHRIPP
jgi:hypothetical protein